VQHRFIKKTGAKLIVVLLALNPVLLRADDPFPSVPPRGYMPNGQAPNGYGFNPVPGGNQPSVAPTQPMAPVRPDSFPGGPGAQPASAAPAYGPLYQPGPQQVPGGVQAARLGPTGIARGTGAATPVAPPELCELSQVLGRVANDVVLTGDVFAGIDDMIGGNRNRIPPEKFAEQRAAVAEEVTAAIHEFVSHHNDPDPVKAMSLSHRGLIYQLVRRQVEVKMIYQDFQRNVPKERFPEIQESVNRHFDETQLKVLMKRENVVSRADLENALRAKGSSLDRERRIFFEQVVAQQWVQQQLKPENPNGGKPEEEEVTHEEMLAWYNAHKKEFELPAKARWEELMVSFARHANHDEAYAILAGLGNQVIIGVPLADVAKKGSEGPTAQQGGQRDWTLKDSLASEVLNQALFSQPIGQLSPRILESEDGFHIIRVLERQELSWTSFLDAQKQVKEKIQNERYEKRYKKFLEELQAKYPASTVFDKSLEEQKKLEE
jgi:hypothetical protein